MPAVMSPSTIPVELLQRYAKSGPRYTSYPTAPQFSTEFDAREVEARWRDSAASGNPVSIYVHLPFCAARCFYCACTTEIGHSRQTIDGYLEALEGESALHVGQIGRNTVAQLALGGGTPTHLAPQQMRRLVSALEDRLEFTSDAERSIEIDPRSVDERYLETLTELGFNRFSFGVQDLDEGVQRNVRRVCSTDRIAGLIAHLRRLGQKAVNVDLMYGLPGQTLESFGVTLDGVRAMEPSRIAVFGYAHVPWVSPHQRALEKYSMPGPDERTALFGLAWDRLTGAGYEHVGMDHFALPGDELIRALRARSLTRSFMGYTTRRGLDLVGIGASAISSVNGTYTQNLKLVPEYLERRAAPWFKALCLSDEDRLRREVILELFCNFHVDLDTVGRGYGVDGAGHFADEIEALDAFAKDGLLRATGPIIEVSELGRFFIRNICMTFDQYLAPGKGRGRYSKTV
jgi:oxygen-independent coproporphyrinogen-3 oxidase